MKKKIGISIIVILMLLILAFFGVGNYFYDFALSRNTSKESVLEANSDDQKEEEQENRIDERKKWFQEKAEDVWITSEDGLALHSYELENESTSNVWVISVHGYNGSGKENTYYPQKFYHMGYHVLVVDLRGHGESEGDYIGMGWPDRKDILKWIDYLVEKDPKCQIILQGVSMGAATVMMTTGEKMPSNVKVAIEDCGYTSVWDEFAGQLQKLFGLPTFPALNAADVVTQIRANYSIAKASSVEQVKKSVTPTLFVHGDKDDFVPFWMLDKVYEAANCEKQKLVIEGAGHAEAADVNEELYWDTVTNFIQTYLK